MEKAQHQDRLGRGKKLMWVPSEPTLEIREDEVTGGPGIVSGPVVVYGDVANWWGLKELFEKGAFGDVSKVDAIGNFMHQRTVPMVRTGGGGLTFEDSDKELRAEIVLPDTQAGRDTATLMRNKVIRGLSVEFFSRRYRIEDNGNKIIRTRADLVGVGVVDMPAFKKSVPSIRWDEDEIDIRRRAEAALWL